MVMEGREEKEWRWKRRGNEGEEGMRKNAEGKGNKKGESGEEGGREHARVALKDLAGGREGGKKVRARRERKQARSDGNRGRGKEEIKYTSNKRTKKEL